MAYNPPSFNLTADIYDLADWPSGSPRLTSISCQWRGVGKAASIYNAVSVTSFSVPTEILFPAGTDVRSLFESATSSYDIIKLYMGGSFRPFRVLDVYDIGKGFTNEYRVAVVVKLAPWTPPIP